MYQNNHHNTVKFLFFNCIIDPLSVDVSWSYWWNGPNLSLIIKSLHSEDQWRSILSCILVLDVLLGHTKKMADKVFNRFDECTGRCIHLFPQEEECSSCSWGDSKIYISGSIGKSQRMLTEINESVVITKISIWVESDTVRHWRYLE